MTNHSGDVAPDFTADTTTGIIDFHEWIGGDWVFFFNHPGDVTPVCTTEICRTAELAAEFAKRHVKALGMSTDGVAEHLSWLDDVNDTQNTTARFPIVSDPERTIVRLYDMIHANQSETAPVRSVFIIDPNRNSPDDDLSDERRAQLRQDTAGD